MTVTQLAYLGFEVSDLSAWASFGTEVLGMERVDEGADGSFKLRMDRRNWRLAIHPGPADDLAYVGWEVSDLLGPIEALEARGVEVGWGHDLTGERAVESLCFFDDPAGVRTELVTGSAQQLDPFHSPKLLGGFVAGQLGLGHVVLTANDKAESRRFYEETLGFRLSDTIVTRYFGYDIDMDFFHANPRHHSLAFGGPQPKKLNHFLLEVDRLDDVGLCMDRTLKAGLPLVQTLGRHPNDGMLSFYAQTPSGFNFECGWGGREVDASTWQPTTYDRLSEWGHHPPMVLSPRKPK
ncbi:MAG: biphenyl 2,3-dioxygenase [Myxococcales bacterium]|nr:biphenyl 2,3-dioxygenase [Myxococcales bacterium]